MERQPTGWERMKAKIFAEPLVPFGAGLTAAILIAGIVTMSKGGSKQTQQKLMQARVLAQGFTLCAIAWGAYETTMAPPPQIESKVNVK